MTNINDFLGFEIEEDLSDSSEDNNNDQQQFKTSKNNSDIFNDRNSKFDALKQKRLQIKEKYEKKAASKLEKKQRQHLNPARVNNTNSSSSKESELDTGARTELHNTDLSFLDEALEEQKIDLALSRNNIDLAEQLSEDLSTKLHEQSMKRALESKEYQKEFYEKNLLKSKRKKPNWRFEPKQRWESKSNM